MTNIDVNHIVGKKIREQRVLAGLTQKQLADELSISEKHLSKIENGVKSATSSLITKLCNVFEKSPVYFFYNVQPTESNTAEQIISGIVEDLKVMEQKDLVLAANIIKQIINR